MTTISEALKEFHLDVKKYLITTGLIGFSYFGFVIDFIESNIAIEVCVWPAGLIINPSKFSFTSCIQLIISPSLLVCLKSM